ncbi:MAG: sigma-70 family RNA polymerase sigma factor [Thermoanaerobaculia bacterium]
MEEPSGSPPSFESLLGQILPGAYRVACPLTGNGADAEDLIQEAALLAFRAFASFAPGSDFKAWFYKILTNRHYERFRRSARRPATVALEEASDLYLYRRTAEAGLHRGCDDPAALVMSKLTTEQVMAAIADLPDEFRAVATLHFVEDMSYQEMAGVLACPAGTVRSRLHRGRKLLQRRLWTVAQENGIIGELTARAASA